LTQVIELLREKGISFKACNLPNVMFVVEIGDFPVHRQPFVLEMLINNHIGYLASLQTNDYYRVFVNKLVIRHYRKFRAWLAGSNVSK